MWQMKTAVHLDNILSFASNMNFRVSGTLLTAKTEWRSLCIDCLLRAGCLWKCGRIPATCKDWYSRPRLQTGPGTYSTSGSVVTGDLPPTLKQPGREVHRSYPPRNVEKDVWLCNSTSSYASTTRKNTTLPFTSQMKHQLDATLCRFCFCKVTLHVSGASAHHQEYLKLVRRALVHVLSLQVIHHI